jgi:hypothetical protein
MSARTKQILDMVIAHLGMSYTESGDSINVLEQERRCKSHALGCLDNMFSEGILPGPYPEVTKAHLAAYFEKTQGMTIRNRWLQIQRSVRNDMAATWRVYHSLYDPSTKSW